MWCVVKCRAGKAGEIMELCRQSLSRELLQETFQFTHDRMRRYEGSWHVECEQMFPEYVFLKTEDPAALKKALKPYQDLVQLLEDGTLLQRVDPEEEKLLRLLGGKEHHLNISQGYIRDGVTYVTGGPLVGLESRIRKIDRHKRTAQIETTDDGLGNFFTAGLEIVSKS